MATDIQGRITYEDILDNVISEIHDPKLAVHAEISLIKSWALDAAQLLCNRLRVRETRELLLIQDQEDYLFQDNTVPVTGTGTITTTGISVAGDTASGTGTISSLGTTVTGVATVFITELTVGQAIIVGTEVKEIMEIHSNTKIIVQTSFTTDIAAGTAFTYTKTKFKRELVVGSSIISSSQTRTIKSITDAYTATVTAPYNPALAAQTFTIDTVATEIPNRIHRINRIDRLEGSFRRETKVVDESTLLAQRVFDEAYTYTNYYRPALASIWRDGSGRKFLKVYPLPDAHKSVTLFCDVKIKPTAYSSVATTAAFPLDEDYMPMVYDYILARLHRIYGKDDKQYKLYMEEYESGIKEMQENIPNSGKLKVVYQ